MAIWWWLLDLHRFIGGATVVFTFVHLGAILTDSFVHFDLVSILVPFAASWNPMAVAWGIVAFYLLLAVEVTSLLRQHMPNRIWRRVHYASFPLFALATIHGVTAGTDTRTTFAGMVLASVVLGVGLLTASRVGRTGARPNVASLGRGPKQEPAMNELDEVLPTVTEIIEGPVTAVDRVYAFDRIRYACREAPRRVQRVRARLSTQSHPVGQSPAIAEGTLMLDGGLVICAGAAANTVRAAVDELTGRLRRRLRSVGGKARRQRMETLPASATSSVSLKRPLTVIIQSPGMGRSTPEAM